MQPREVKISKECLHGYIDVENQGVKIPLTDEEINALKYIPERKVKSKRNKVTSAQWFGYCKNSRTNVQLDEAYVLENFSKEIIADVRQMGIMGAKKFIPVSPGAPKKHENFPSHLRKGPKIKYRQKEGEHTCMVYSFASALHYIGEKQYASEIYKMHKKIVNCKDAVGRFSDYVRQINEKFQFYIFKTKEWNILENAQASLVLVTLGGSNGKQDHCVTLCGKWVFDSNFEYALPLCQESLDLCCSTDDIQAKFEKVVDARVCKYIDVTEKLAEVAKKVKEHKKKKKQKLNK